MHNEIKQSIESTFLFFSKLKKPFDVSQFWPASISPEKSFEEISQNSKNLKDQLISINKTVAEVIFKKIKQSGNNNLSIQSKGRFLIYSPFHATMDALASMETFGFFDEADAPPWTTWIIFQIYSDVSLDQHEGYLAAWIIPELVDIAQSGIDVCLGKSLFWADDLSEAATYGDNALNFCKKLLMINTEALKTN